MAGARRLAGRRNSAARVAAAPDRGYAMPMLRTARLAGAALAAAVLLPTTPALGATHLVAPGETLWGIALSNGLPASAVAAANGLSPEARVISGTTLTIPARGTVPAVGSAPAAGAPA